MQEVLDKIEPVDTNLTELLHNIGVHPMKYVVFFSLCHSIENFCLVLNKNDENPMLEKPGKNPMGSLDRVLYGINNHTSIRPYSIALHQ